MSLTMTKADGVTVFTLTSDPESTCPPLCQILTGLCYSPACCSLSQHLRRVQRTSQSVLGALHITVGLLNIGLGAIIEVRSSPYPFWLGGMFILFGIVSILSEKYPSPCLVILNVTLNLFGVLFAIAAIVLYSIDIAVINLWWMCEEYYDYFSHDSTPSPHEDVMKEICMKSRTMALMLIRSIIAVLIVLSVLELCIAISSAVLGIKALRSRGKRGNESTDDPECYKPRKEKNAINPSV
ncbi:transmembrane protein 176B-like [Sparus aurata]|uniref:Transmembrane protein 176B-like n=1 Tax=Sparus aurata TaxID=8175 RepID=A0A671W8H6_SPAAU|nr:transmembrane protein 176B-like [Sparus aurata]